MRFCDYLIDYLTNFGITCGYFMIGGSLGYVADSAARKKFPLYTLHHEQAAAFAAEGAAASTKKPTLALATSGPGATNLVTGIGSAYFASLPLICITGQVNTFESNADGKRRQVGFQETDIVSIVKSITKYAIKISDPAMSIYELEKALFISTNGRMGPVLIDLPLDIQKSEIDPQNMIHFIGSDEYKSLMNRPKPDFDSIKKVVSALENSLRPILLIGHGVRLSNSEKKVRSLIEKLGIPTVTSLMGTDSIPSNHPLFYGFIGTYAQRYSNFALANSDLILVLGARLDSRQVGVSSKKFAPMAKIIHVDIDKNELGRSVSEWLSINSDIGDFLDLLLPYLKKQNLSEWISFLDWLKKTYSSVEQKLIAQEINPVYAIEQFSKQVPESSVISVDVGANQMWFAQGWQVKSDQCILTDGGMAPMGFALPAAIGYSLSSNAPSFVVSGDGGMQINIQELQTIVRHKLNVKIMVLNNNALGMLTQFQTENFEGRLIGSVDGYDAPCFEKIATAYGIPSLKVSNSKDLSKSINWLISQKGSALLEVIVPRSFWTLPKSRFSRPVHDMTPFLDRAEYKKALKYVDEKFID